MTYAEKAVDSSGVKFEKGRSTDNVEEITSKMTVHQRETWVGKLDFVLALIGFSVGLGNIWRFPYLCYKNGGGAFLVPYFIMLIFAGVPLLILEVGIGQFMSEGGITVWKLCPLMQGIGVASVVIVQFLNIYYVIILGWAIYYMFMSFTTVLPWSHCDNYWNTEKCAVNFYENFYTNYTNVTINGTSQLIGQTFFINETRTSPIVEFWERNVLTIHLSEGLHDLGDINWKVAGSLFFGWVLVYLCVWKGVKSTGRVVYFTATFPYVLLTILMIRAVTLEGALEGIIFYLKPDISRLSDGQVWIDAGTQVFFSYSIAIGTLIALGSYNKYHHNMYRDTVIFACVNSGTSLYGGFVIFSTIGFMAHTQNVDISEVAKSGPGLAFIAYPAAVAEMPLAPLWSVLFFFMVILLGLDSEFVGVEGFVTAMADLFPQYLRVGNRKPIFILACCTFWFLLGLTMVTSGGMYVFQLFDSYSASGLCLLWVATFQAITVGLLYGGKRFYENLEDMLGFRIGPWCRICWMSFTPILSMVILIFWAVTYSPLTYETLSLTYEYPIWGEAIGWVMAMCSMICIPLVAIVKIIKTEGTLKERLIDLTTPRLKYREKEEEGINMTSPQNYEEAEPAYV